MKKNLSLLSKVGISLSAAALLAGSAWALMAPPAPVDDTVEEIWTVPTNIDVDKPVTFVAVKDKDNIMQMDKTFTGIPYDVDANNGLDDGAGYQFGVTQKNNYLMFKNDDNQYLVEDGTVALHDETSEVMWSYSTPNLQAKSNSRYLYYSAAANKFDTSVDTKGAIIFQKGDVKKPTITLSDNALDYTIDKTATAPAIRVSATDNIKPTLTLSDPESKLTNGQKTDLVFEVQCSDVDKSIPQTKLTKADGDKVLNLVDYAGTHIKVIVFTRVYATANDVTFQISKTTTVEYECDVVELANPTLQANSTRLAEKEADADKKITVQVDKEGKASVKAVNASTTTGNTVMISENSDMSGAKKKTSVVDYIGNTVYATVKTELDGVETDAFPYTIEVLPNLSADEVTALFGTIDPDPAAGTRQKAGTKVTLKYEVETDAQKIYEISPAAPNIEVKVTVGAATTPVTITATKNAAEDGYEFDLPDALLTEGFSVAVPAGSFVAKGSKAATPQHVGGVSTNPYINQFYSPEATFTYQNKYDGQTFEIDPAHSYIDTDATAKFRFNITAPTKTQVLPVALADEAIVWELGDYDLTGKVKVTNSLNKDVTASYTVKYNRTDANDVGYYEVEFTDPLPADDYMVMFPASSLIDSKMSGQSTNKDNVTAYIHVMPKVDFAYILANDPAATTQPEKICCTEDLYVIVKPTSTLGDRTAKLKQTDLLKAKLTNNKPAFQEIELEATTTNNVFKVTSDLEGTGKLFNEYTSYFKLNLEIPAGLFEADNTVCPDLATAAQPKPTVYHHVDYSVENNTTPIIVDSKATSFSFDLKAISDKDKVQTISGTYTVKFNGNDATMTVAAPDAAGISKATISGDFSTLNGDYTVTIPANTLSKTSTGGVKNCGCEQPELTVNVKVGTVGYTFAAVKGITTNDDTFLMTAKCTLEGAESDANLAVAIPAADVVDVEGVKGQITGYDFSNKTYTVKLASKLARKPAGAKYTVTVAKDKFESGTGSKNDGTETFELGVEQYVNFAVASPEYLVETSTDPTEFDFAIATTPATIDGEDICVGLAAEISVLKNLLSVNDGGTMVKPTDVTYVKEDDKGNSVFHVVLEKSLAANNYMLGIAPGALSALYNTNPTKLQVNFVVKNKVTFADVETYTQKVASVDVAYDAKNVYASRASEVVADITNWTVPAGTKVTAATGGFKLEKTDGTDLTVGSYEVIAPKGSLKADASENTADVKFTVNVIDVVFEIEDITMNSYPYAYVNSPKFPVKAYSVAADGIKTEVELEDFWDVIYKSSSAPNILVDKDGDAAYSELNSVWDATAKKATIEEINATQGYSTLWSDYKLTIPANIVTGIYQGIEFTNAEPLTATLKVAKQFVFNDGVGASKETTTFTEAEDASKSGSIDELTYKRTFKTAAVDKFQALNVPFSINVTDETDAQMSIYRINFFYNTEDQTLDLKLNKIEAGDATVAYMPYVAVPHQEDVELVLEGVKVDFSENGGDDAISCSNVKESYVIKGTTAKAVPGKEFFALGSNGTWAKGGTSASVGAWKWYMTSSSNSVNYARIYIDGFEDDATAINAVESESSNDVIYGIDGVRRSAPVKGINIINGKKVYVK